MGTRMDNIAVGRGLVLNGLPIFTDKRVYVETLPDGNTRLSWTWLVASAYTHLGWFMRQLNDRMDAVTLVGDLCHWQTYDLDTETVRTIHGWPSMITIVMPDDGPQAILHVLLHPMAATHG
jgi:hypothetical protein